MRIVRIACVAEIVTPEVVLLDLRTPELPAPGHLPLPDHLSVAYRFQAPGPLATLAPLPAGDSLLATDLAVVLHFLKI